MCSATNESMYVGIKEMYAWCECNVKYLFPNIFQWGPLSLIQGFLVTLEFTSLNKNIWLGHSDTKTDKKETLHVPRLTMGLCAITFFGCLPYFDHCFVEPSHLVLDCFVTILCIAAFRICQLCSSLSIAIYSFSSFNIYSKFSIKW